MVFDPWIGDIVSRLFRVYRAGVNWTPGSPGFDVTKPRTPGLKNETRGWNPYSLIATPNCVPWRKPLVVPMFGLVFR